MSNETTKARYRRLKAAGLCVQCGDPNRPLDLSSKFHCSVCKIKNNTHTRKKRKELIEKGICTCGRPTKEGCTKCAACFDSNKEYVEKNRALVRQRANERYRRIKDDCLSHYGRVCACCGDPNLEFLQIDHVDGGGREHRASGVTSIFYWLRSHKYPPGFQTLCSNCNWAKRQNPHCPLRDTVCKARRERLIFDVG